MSSLYYHDLVGKIEEHDDKKYLTLGNNILNEVLDKIRDIIGIEKFDEAKILIGQFSPSTQRHLFAASRAFHLCTPAREKAPKTL